MGSLFLKPPFWSAILAAVALAGVSYRLRWLSKSGSIATCFVGCIIFGLGGGAFAVPLLAFFLSSSILSHIGKSQKSSANLHDAKGSRRDAGQVLANGGVATALTLVYAIEVHTLPAYKIRFLLLLYLTALATVNADTWATEIGKLSHRKPLPLLTGKPVAKGASGAISVLGTLGAFAGAALIPTIMLGIWRLNPMEVTAVAWAGFMGSLVDSLLGAYAQAQYRTPEGSALTERAEIEGKRLVLARGAAWVTNDVVNFLASAAGAAIAWALLKYVGYRPY